MRDIIIISRCQKIRNRNAIEQTGEFHFKGVYLGESIKKIVLSIPLHQTITVDEEYILHIKLQFIDEHCLWGKIIKSKRLADCFVCD